MRKYIAPMVIGCIGAAAGAYAGHLHNMRELPQIPLETDSQVEQVQTLRDTLGENNGTLHVLYCTGGMETKFIKDINAAYWCANDGGTSLKGLTDEVTSYYRL